MVLSDLLLRMNTEGYMEDLWMPRLQVRQAVAVVEADCSPDHGCRVLLLENRAGES